MRKTNHAVLKYQVLSILRKEGTLTPTEITEKVADFFGIPNEERDECYPNRPNDKVFYKRVATNDQHLQGAGLIEFTKDGYHIITPRGIRALEDNCLMGAINYEYLRTIPDYQVWCSRTKKEDIQEEEICSIVNRIDNSTARYDILSFLKDKKAHSQTEIVNHLAEVYDLTKEELEEKYSNGNLKFYKCIAGIEQQLKRAGWEKIDNNNHSITEKGLKLLENSNGSISYKELCNLNSTIESSRHINTNFNIYIGNDGQPHYQNISRNECTMYVIPRKDFDRTTDKTLLEYPCLYILLDEICTKANCYIGYTGNPIERISTHKSLKKGEGFWNYALVFEYYNANENVRFDMCDTSYLEYLSFNKANPVYNTKSADEPYIKPKAKEIVEKAFFDIQNLVSEIGLNIFKE